MTRISALMALILTCGTVSAAPIVNGDFQTGNLSGWTVFTTANGNNGAGLPNVVSFDTTGGGASLAAHFQVGQNVFTSGVPAGGGIFQNVSLGTGTLTIDLDVAAFNPGGQNVAAGLFELLLDGVVVDSTNLTTINTGQTLRDSLSFATNVLAGSHEIRVRVSRPFLNSTGTTPEEYLDNIRISGTAVNAQAVPEPSTFAIFGIIGAFGAVCLYSRRRFLTSHNPV